MNEDNNYQTDSDQKQQQTITNMSAQFIHDIATPLASIQLISTILDTYMPVMLSAYTHLKSQDSQDGSTQDDSTQDGSTQGQGTQNQGAQAQASQDKLTIGDIPPEHYQTLVHAAAEINHMARQVKTQSKQYWQQIDEQYSQDSGNTEMSRQSYKAPNRSSEAVSVSLLGNLRILVAEDDRLHQKIATKLLNKHHLNIVANGQQAIEAVQQNTYDLLLMDLSMPVMNGQQAVAIISGAILKKAITEEADSKEIRDGLDKLPVMIGLTNKPLSNEEKHQLLEQGFQGILEKPLNMDDLNQLLNHLQQT
jgi:CheY-like chemotaxis protein